MKLRYLQDCLPIKTVSDSLWFKVNSENRPDSYFIESRLWSLIDQCVTAVGRAAQKTNIRKQN